MDQNGKRRVAPLLMVFALTAISGVKCDFDPLVAESQNWRTVTEGVLNDGISAINRASSDWQQVLSDAQAKLTEDVQSTVRIELQQLATTTVAVGAASVHCTVDFLRQRVRQGLERIKAKFLKEPAPTFRPGLCTVVPPALDRAKVPNPITHVTYYGYNFDFVDTLKVFHHHGNRKTDVTQEMDFPTPYVMTLKFGVNGITLNGNSERLTLEWDGGRFSSLAIIQPETPVCRSKDFRIEGLEDKTVTPVHIGEGNRNFGNNGPKVFVSARLEHDSRTLFSHLYMYAYESDRNGKLDGDKTAALKEESHPIFNAPSGFRIESIQTGLRSSDSYIDDSKDVLDVLKQGSGGPVARFEIMGRTSGDDVEQGTKMDVVYNPITVVLTEDKNCVPVRAVRSLARTDLLGERTRRRLGRNLRLPTPVRPRPGE